MSPYYPIGDPRHKADTRVRPNRKDYHKSGDRHLHKVSKFKDSDFIAWDGEGLNLVKQVVDPKEHSVKTTHEHVYALLMNNVGDRLTKLNGLSSVQCFELLLKCASEHPTAIHVCFGASYDVNMMLKDVPLQLLRRLHKGKRIIWHVSRTLAYSLQYRPRKSFFVARFVQDQRSRFTKVIHKDGSTSVSPNYTAKCTVWDVFGFFQIPFVAALQKYFSAEEQKELHLDRIIAGKRRRSDFSPVELNKFIIPYTALEVQALVALMERLRSYLSEADISITRYDGAGAIAASILKKHNIKQYHGVTPAPVNTAALHAYSAGRIEAMMYGNYKGSIYHYDINSAYPSAMLTLPDLSKGEWIHYKRQIWPKLDPYDMEEPLNPFSDFSLFKVSWRFPHMPFYPFFTRGKDKAIDYPQAGLNWIWYAELKAALETIPHCWKYIHIHEVYCFMPDSIEQPFAFVQELYDSRKADKLAGRGSEKAKKLGINSLYGKTVQHLGYDKESGRIPPYYNILWGGNITSQTRAKLFRAGIQHPENIIAFSTDGIWSTFPLDLPIGDDLGQWSYDECTGMTLVQSGVYWTDDKQGKEHQWYRGFDKEHLTRDRVNRAWMDGETSLCVPTTRFVTLGSALASEGRFLSKWRQWDTTDRELKLTAQGTKRVEEYRGGARKSFHPIWGKRNPSKELIPTIARSNPHITYEYAEIFPYPDEYMSVKAEQPWERDEKGMEEQKLQEIVDMEIQESEF